MPRLPVDGVKVQEIRLTMGTKERQLAESAITAFQVKSILPSVANVLGDVSALYAVGSLFEILTGKDIPGLYNPEEIVDGGTKAAMEMSEAIKNAGKEYVNEKVEEAKQTATTMEDQEVRRERATSLGGGILNLFDTFFAVISGGHANEFLRAKQQEATE